jgi:hypothetical protein
VPGVTVSGMAMSGMAVRVRMIVMMGHDALAIIVAGQVLFRPLRL